METFIAFLRGINVGGQKKMPMAEVRKMMADAKFKAVKTYIQSGNIVFKSERASTEELQGSVHAAIEKKFGFEVPVLVKSVREVRAILDQNPFENKDDLAENRIYFVLLQNIPDQGLVRAFEENDYPHERFSVSDSCVYLCCKNGYGKAKLDNNLIERKLQVNATARNYRTMKKLLELSEDN